MKTELKQAILPPALLSNCFCNYTVTAARRNGIKEKKKSACKCELVETKCNNDGSNNKYNSSNNNYNGSNNNYKNSN